MELAVKGKAKAKRRHLNAEQCDDLGRTAEGAHTLTQPQSVNHRQRRVDVNKGLHPRTPTKRQKCVSAPGSPAGQQKVIRDFFSVSGIISSSPRKSAEPPSSTHTRSLHGEEPKVMEEEGDDEDDTSLLAAVMEMATEVKEDEVDYLEGITAEMFWDNEFDRCDDDVSQLACEKEEEEKVEALPDAHFGLLGSSGRLVEPQGCIDDLPEEILRLVLCALPAQDLYRNISLVCHRWRDIVQDDKFVPLKKQYYRYTMREEVTVQQIHNILKTSSITDPAEAQHSVRHLVVLMSQHQVGECIRPEDVLQCVKKHRLFPQVEACLRLRIPHIQQHLGLDIEGPNPYAAMAVMLILSESVRDVQDLVSLLTSCMSHTAITEYLSHMATMLLAMMRNGIQISNRVHYNVYYVLHLMENGPFSASSSGSRRPHIQLTHEQQQILSHDIQASHVVKIIAFAGTGKTTTLVKYAEQRPHLRFLYVAFNKSVANEARSCFSSNVDCKTVHSLAFSDIGKRYHILKKLTFNVKPYSIASVLPAGRSGFVNGKVVSTTINAFMASTDPRINFNHVPDEFINTRGLREIMTFDQKQDYVKDAEVIWNKMKELRKTDKEGHHISHDGYLKLWQLQNPKPCLSDQYDVIFIDEAQDCTPAIMDVLLSQRCAKILVGDPHQQIYTFRGAVNALRIMPHTHIYYLTQSFRFGSEIAYVGATILKVCKHVEKILVGGKQDGGICDQTADMVAAMIKTGKSHSQGTTAILSRCNFNVFNEAVRLIDANNHCRIHFVGGIANVGLNKIMDIWHLNQGRTKLIRDSFIRIFLKSKKCPYATLKAYAIQAMDRELEAKLAIVEKYMSRIPELVEHLNRCYISNLQNADFIIGTVHKAKGLEFDTVMVTDDFVKLPCARHRMHQHPGFSWAKFLHEVPEDEWNLLYVAATRARTSLIITQNILHILSMAWEYFLKSESMDSMMKKDTPLPCSVTDCPNCIMPSSAFIMCKRRMKLTDSVSAGGPLCEKCVWKCIGPTAFLMTDEVFSMADIRVRLDEPNVHAMLLVPL
ncbi:hypothetical protein LDENG_00264360 [Lucifuga dentata]|nr:hypothetical protein LDENG_00264360 [Lucifuga dentata]